jgi:hypothetical protein
MDGSTFSDIDGDGDQDVLIKDKLVLIKESQNLYVNDGRVFYRKKIPFEGVYNNSIASQILI